MNRANTTIFVLLAVSSRKSPNQSQFFTAQSEPLSEQRCTFLSREHLKKHNKQHNAMHDKKVKRVLTSRRLASKVMGRVEYIFEILSNRVELMGIIVIERHCRLSSSPPTKYKFFSKYRLSCTAARAASKNPKHYYKSL